MGGVYYFLTVVQLLLVLFSLRKCIGLGSNTQMDNFEVEISLLDKY